MAALALKSLPLLEIAAVARNRRRCSKSPPLL
jgi:hypothetical protein